MLVHSVYFWLKDKEDANAQSSLLEGLQSLQGITSVQSVFVGEPAATDRPVIDSSYDFALVLIFESMEQHDTYQVDPIHLKFVDEKSPLWKKVQIYDFDTL